MSLITRDSVMELNVSDKRCPVINSHLFFLEENFERRLFTILSVSHLYCNIQHS